MNNFSTTFERLYKLYYDMGIYTKADIKSFVQLGCVGSDAYKRITGDDYEQVS